MELTAITYQGPALSNLALLESLPADYVKLLRQINGFIQFGGGLHIRGLCEEPAWHNLTNFWRGSFSLSKSYPVLLETDLPFGEDALGDQFILRNGLVYKLLTETGELETFDCNLFEFLEAAQTDPVEYLALEPLVQFQQEGGKLEPGQLLSAYPPFCTQEAANGVSLKAVDLFDRLKFLADFSAQVNGLSDGTPLTMSF